MADKYVTPKCELMYPFIFQPSTMFDPDGRYEIQILLHPQTNKEHHKFMSDLKKMWEETKGKNKPWKQYVDENDEKTNSYTVRFKSKFPVVVFDAHGNKIKSEKNIVANGSKGKVSYVMQPYKQQGGGLGLYFQAIQIIELIEWKGGESEDYGFDEEEGYDHFNAKDVLEELDEEADKIREEIENPPDEDIPF